MREKAARVHKTKRNIDGQKGLAPYENARHFLGLSERSWVNWTEEVRHHCGKELLRRGMFPPRKYFSEST
jgi:hypothetical protein